MAGLRYTAEQRTARRRIRDAVVEENLRAGNRRRVRKREVDHAVTDAQKSAAPHETDCDAPNRKKRRMGGPRSLTRREARRTLREWDDVRMDDDDHSSRARMIRRPYISAAGTRREGAKKKP